MKTVHKPAKSQYRNAIKQTAWAEFGLEVWRTRTWRARAYNGGLWAEPAAGSRGRAPGPGSGEFRPVKLKDFLGIGRPK